MDYVGQIRAFIEGGIRLSLPVALACAMVIFASDKWPSYFSGADPTILAVVSIIGVVSFSFFMVGLISLIWRWFLIFSNMIIKNIRAAHLDKKKRHAFLQKVELLRSAEIWEVCILTALLISGERRGDFNPDNKAVIDLVGKGILVKSLGIHGRWIFTIDEPLWRALLDMPEYRLESNRGASVSSLLGGMHYDRADLVLRLLPQGHPVVKKAVFTTINNSSPVGN